MTLFEHDHLFKYPISKYSCIVEFRDFNIGILREPNSSHNREDSVKIMVVLLFQKKKILIPMNV